MVGWSATKPPPPPSHLAPPGEEGKKEHFNDLLNRPSTTEQNALDALVQQPIKLDCDHAPTVVEIRAALEQLTCGKAAGRMVCRLKYGCMVENR